MVTQIGFFFKAYNEAYGKKFKVLGVASAKKANEAVRRGEKKAQKQK